MNPFLRPLVGAGRLPEQLRAELARDGLLFLEEGLSGSITYRHYRAPGKRTNLKKELIAGVIAITHNRLVVWTRNSKHIDVPLAHGLRGAIEVVADRPDRLRFGYEASAFSQSRSGRVEVRLRTPEAARVAAMLGAGPPVQA
jgi:hypothetical protein